MSLCRGMACLAFAIVVTLSHAGEELPQSNWSPSFVSYIKTVENGCDLGIKKSKFYPYPSPEGGMPTIGYGHKIHTTKELKKLKSGLTQEDAETLLKEDLKKAWEKTVLIMHRDGIDASSLSSEQKEMLLDYAFNGVLHKFPRFRKAVVDKNWPLVIEEYSRYYRPKKSQEETLPLKDRNEKFFLRYLVAKIDPIYTIRRMIESTTISFVQSCDTAMQSLKRPTNSHDTDQAAGG